MFDYCLHHRKDSNASSVGTKVSSEYRAQSTPDETNAKDIHKEVAHLIFPCSRYILELEKKYGLTIYTSPSFNSKCKAAFMSGDYKSIIGAMSCGIYCIRRQKNLDRMAEKMLIRFITNMPFEGRIFNDFKRDGQRASFHARNVIERGKYKRNKRGIRRLYLILLKLEALVYYRHSLVALCKDYVDYLNNFFEIIRDPVVSVHEVESLLRSIFDDPFNDEAINRICHDFLLLFPDSTQKYRPRTLKHLSRCSVRKSLQKAGNLQNLVFKLPVPDSIKAYILVFDMVWRRPVPQLVNTFIEDPEETSTVKYC